MKLHSLLIVAAMGAMPAFAQDAAKPAVPAAATASMNVTDPQQFAQMATVSNMFEIESSKLALQKATRQDAKDFAQRMIDDHTKAGEEMKAAADAQAGITLPAALDQKHQAMLDQLNATTGSDFDAQYLKMQLAAHQEAVALFDGFSKNGADGKLKDFAAKTLPTLQQHLEMVSGMVGGDQAAASAATPAAGTTSASGNQSILATGYVPTDKDNLATEIVGTQVYSSGASDAEHIGDVNNLVIGENGEIAAVVIGVGGFLGIGEKDVAVKYSELQRVTADDNTERFILPTTKDALGAAPDFQTSDTSAPVAGAAPASTNGAATPAAPATK